MLKVRLQGTVSDMKWFRQLLEKHEDIEVLRVSDPRTNRGREDILPSEKAFAYKMKLEALKHQGKVGEFEGEVTLEEATPTPTPTAKPTQKNTSLKSPKTGDHTPVTIWLLMILASGSIIGAVCLKKRTR